MINYFRSHLGARLFLSYLAIILVGFAVLAASSQFALPSSFNRHMLGIASERGINAGTGAGSGGMGMGHQGAGGPGPLSQLFIDYRASFNDALFIATVVAILAALVVSLFFIRSVIAPVRAISIASQRIADGHYNERVPASSGRDELSQLASHFNQMAERLDQVETMRRHLIGDVSHEMRTPLTAIQGSMEGLMDHVLPASDETYKQIHLEAARLNRLVDDLQELSRVESNASPLNLQTINIGTLAQTVSKRLGPQADLKHITLSFELPPNLPSPVIDEDRIVQVLSNLVSNALQYTPEGGSVTVSACLKGGFVEVSVRDTGIGIPPEHLSRVFDRFYRVDKSRSRQAGGGSGIGLTIARALVEAHGGRIWAESTGDGEGSVFTFTLPIAS